MCSFVLFCFGHCIAFPFYILAIALLTRRFTESDYPYVIFKLILCIQNLSYSFYFFLLHMLYCLSILCCFVGFFCLCFCRVSTSTRVIVPFPHINLCQCRRLFIEYRKKRKLIRTKIFSLPGCYWISTNSNHAL